MQAFDKNSWAKKWRRLFFRQCSLPLSLITLTSALHELIFCHLLFVQCCFHCSCSGNYRWHNPCSRASLHCICCRHNSPTCHTTSRTTANIVYIFIYALRIYTWKPSLYSAICCLFNVVFTAHVVETIDGTILVPEPHCTAFAVDIIVQPGTQHQELQQTLYIYLYMHSESTRGSRAYILPFVVCSMLISLLM